MKFFAIDVQLPETTEFLEATDAQIAEWVRLHALCAKQVNGGRIEAAKSLPVKFWERHGINPATLFDPSPLWHLKADTLVLEHFDHQGQRIFMQKSNGGKTRAEQMWGNGKSRSPSSSPRNTLDRNADSPIPSHPVPSQPIPNESLSLDGASSNPQPRKAEANTQAEAIYQVYPRRVKKPEALNAIRKAMSSHAPDFLLERTQAYAAAIGWQERNFIPHPATWFNNEQFNDDPEDWKQPSPSHAGPSPRPRIVPDIGGRKPSSIADWDNARPISPEDYAEIEF